MGYSIGTDWLGERRYKRSIDDDVLLVGKQFMVFAHLRCPKPPIRVAKGLLQSTIRMKNESIMGMDAVVCMCGSKQAYYMPYTNEVWKSRKAFHESKYTKELSGTMRQDKLGRWVIEVGVKKTLKKGRLGIRKNPNEHWWDKSITDTIGFIQQSDFILDNKLVAYNNGSVK